MMRQAWRFEGEAREVRTYALARLASKETLRLSVTYLATAGRHEHSEWWHSINSPFLSTLPVFSLVLIQSHRPTHPHLPHNPQLPRQPSPSPQPLPSPYTLYLGPHTHTLTHTHTIPPKTIPPPIPPPPPPPPHPLPSSTHSSIFKFQIPNPTAQTTLIPKQSIRLSDQSHRPFSPLT